MPTNPTFDDDVRYSRQILFPGIGAEGQSRLRNARAVIVGVGATGAATASLLARAGVGNLTLIDRDFVEPSNLQRQILFDEADARDALPKAEAARRRIAAFNSSIAVDAVVADLVPGNIHRLLGGTHLILDCTDNFETRYLLNDYAVQQSIPWIYAAAVGSYAATMTILPRNPTPGAAPLNPETPAGPPETPGAPHLDPEMWVGPPQTLGAPHLDSEMWAGPPPKPTACLACIFPTPPAGPVETCDTAGILGSTVNLAASIQSAEALKLLTGQPNLVRRTLLSFDLWTNQRSDISTSTPSPDCTVCGPNGVFTHLAGAARPHITLCGRNSVQIHEHHRPIDLAALAQRLAQHADIGGVRSNAMLLRFARGENTITVFPDGRALIQGTTDPAVARSLYARFIGS